jgi:hypothetical protein
MIKLLCSEIPKYEHSRYSGEQTGLQYLLLGVARLGDKLRKFLHANRLGEILVNASVESIRPGFFAGNAGQSADVSRSEAVAAFVLTDLSRGFEAVHDRHILNAERVSKKLLRNHQRVCISTYHVHQNQEVLVRILLELVKSFEAVFGGLVGQALFLHEGYEQLEEM